ncbi:MAG: glycosyltransferase [Rhizomicrobium sp.]
MIAVLILSLLPLAIWLVLVFARHSFWLMRERDSLNGLERPMSWPSVAAVVPARDEAETIERTLKSLLAQDYAGSFRIILVDDQSSDGTAELARALNDARIDILTGVEHPEGWTGKLFALSQGVAALDGWHAPEYLWFTDADIAHKPDSLRALVTRAEAEGLVLTSLMARLNCTSFAEKFLIPAFVFFFAMLYPFGAVNNRKSHLAGAAGGCMLIRRTALEKAGGVEAIRGEIIDDCAMGKLMKKQGPIWLGLTNRVLSLRPYPKIADIHAMVARTAYAQLHYSPVLLTGTLIGLFIVFLLPVFDLLFGGFFFGGFAALCGALSWALMAIAFQPTLRFYHRSPFWGLALPLIGAVYGYFTLDSALQHAGGKGGMWKGRAQAATKKS